MSTNDDFHHIPVLRDEVVDLFRPVPDGWIVDATVGGGGHSHAILSACPGLSVLGLDRDASAIDAATRRLAPFGDRARVRRYRFDHMSTALDREGIGKVSGVLMDLGVSSPQLDRPERGFSYRANGPLDMRMDQATGETVEAIVNGYSTDALARVLRDHADVPGARRVAEAIVRRRPIADTDELVAAVEEGSPGQRYARAHPARKVFQALRIEVNDELDQLIDGLDQAIDRLVFGGRAVVLSYHSGEDRIVKERFRRVITGGCGCPPQLPCVCGAVPEGVRIQKLVKATAAEIDANPRAKAVRMRAVERRQAQ